MSGQMGFFPILNGYENLISSGKPRLRRNITVLTTKSLVQGTKTILLIWRAGLLSSLRLMAVYALFGKRQSDFFRYLENFHGVLHSIVLLDDFDTICGTCVGCVGSAQDRSAKLAPAERLMQTRIPYDLLWIWASGTGLLDLD